MSLLGRNAHTQRKMPRGQIQPLSMGKYRSSVPSIASRPVHTARRLRLEEPSPSLKRQSGGRGWISDTFYAPQTSQMQRKGQGQSPATKAKKISALRSEEPFSLCSPAKVNEIWLKITVRNKPRPFRSPFQCPLPP